MAKPTDAVWKSSDLATTFLEGVRGAIPFAQAQIDIMLRLIAACERPIERILDLGCGDGVLAAAILDRWPQARAVLLDFSEPMLDAARKRFSERAGSVEILSVDYGQPSWTRAAAPFGPFDAVVSGFSIHHQPDTRKNEIYAEIHELLASGGIFVNVEHVAPGSPWLGRVNDEAFLDSLQRWQPAVPREEIETTYYRRADKDANILAPVETQCEWLRAIGFTDVDCYFKAFELAVFGGRRATSGTASSTPPRP
ncbi:MAG: methyltransferase domain-containing protein [Bryobacteraceae bacterium]|jgi:SAM-dependent methyltransferase